MGALESCRLVWGREGPSLAVPAQQAADNQAWEVRLRLTGRSAVASEFRG